MAELIKRQKWIGIAILAIIAIAAIAYLLDFPPFVPTSWEARTALAEAGWCKPDAPINWRDGQLVVGHVRVQPGRRWFYGGEWNTRESQGEFSYSWDISFSTPFGYWVASRRAIVIG